MTGPTLSERMTGERGGALPDQLRKVDGGRRAEVITHLFQLWFNTLGPGAKTWFGNCYFAIRHYTFRLRWKP